MPGLRKTKCDDQARRRGSRGKAKNFQPVKGESLCDLRGSFPSSGHFGILERLCWEPSSHKNKCSGAEYGY